MADDADFSTEASPSLTSLVEYFVATITSPGALERYEGAVKNAIQKAATTAKGAEHKAAAFTANLLGEFLSAVEEQVEPIMGPFLTKLAGHLIGQEISVEELRKSAVDGGETQVGAAMAKMAFDALSPPEGDLEPGDEGAKRMLGTFAQLVFNGWFEATAFEMLATLFPDMDSFESIAELPHELVNALGLSRLARTGLRPLARIAIATPMEWKLNKSHRPNLLSEGDIIKAFQRGDYTGDDAAEELARLGYSNRRQDMLIKSAAKRLSTDDVQVLRRARVLDRDYALQNLRDEGYDDTTAAYAVTAAEERRLAGIRDDSLGTIIRAYADRDIDEGQFRSMLQGVVDDDDEVSLHFNVADRQRAFNIKHLSKGEVIECIRGAILPFAYYRDWLRREGYPEEEATALEVLLRTQIDADIKAEQHRANVEAEKAKAAADKRAADEQHLADLEAQRALLRRGSIADLRRAVARGLIALDRLAEVLRPQYDADTVQIILNLAEQDRLAYVAQQQAADDAKKRAAARSIDLGALEQGVLHHILTVDAYRQAVADSGFSAADVSILTATLAAKLQDQDKAAAQRAAAEQAAKVKHIDLARLERLVRRGIRPLSDYDAQLHALGYDDASRVAMLELLNAELADDTAARKLRDAAKTKAAGADLTLEQFRRAVILGLRTDEQFQSYLVHQGYTADAQAVLVAELRRDVVDAESARRQRETSDGAAAGVDLPLSRVTAAARLGIITPDAYADRLRAIGYSDDDVAIEMELLITEIAQVQASRAHATAADAANAGRGLSLADLARAVKAGTATRADYRARAVALGFSADDAETLAATLDAELATYAQARTRRTVVARELVDRGVDLDALEADVSAGALTVDAYRAQLQDLGYGAADAQLLGALLTFTLAGGAS